MGSLSSKGKDKSTPSGVKFFDSTLKPLLKEDAKRKKASDSRTRRTLSKSRSRMSISIQSIKKSQG